MCTWLKILFQQRASNKAIYKYLLVIIVIPSTKQQSIQAIPMQKQSSSQKFANPIRHQLHHAHVTQNFWFSHKLTRVFNIGAISTPLAAAAFYNQVQQSQLPHFRMYKVQPHEQKPYHYNLILIVHIFKGEYFFAPITTPQFEYRVMLNVHIYLGSKCQFSNVFHSGSLLQILDQWQISRANEIEKTMFGQTCFHALHLQNERYVQNEDRLFAKYWEKKHGEYEMMVQQDEIHVAQ